MPQFWWSLPWFLGFCLFCRGSSPRVKFSSLAAVPWFGCFRAPSLAVLAVVSFVLASVLLYPLEGNRLLILTNKCLCFSFGNDFPPPQNKCRDQVSSPNPFLNPNRVFLSGLAAGWLCYCCCRACWGPPGAGSFGVLWLVGLVVWWDPPWIAWRALGVRTGSIVLVPVWFWVFVGSRTQLPRFPHVPPPRPPESVP